VLLDDLIARGSNVDCAEDRPAAWSDDALALRFTYATDAEMAAALADLDRRIGATSAPRVSQVRISSSKGT
jgi:hypothetical protein